MSHSPAVPKRVARVLAEALPYIQRFAGATFVIKYGGNAMVEHDLTRSFARDIVLLKCVGMNPVVVHGGGPQIGEWLDRIGKKSEFVGGMRITDEETMEVVEMVLGGLVNKTIVSRINDAGGRAVGLTGKDGRLLTARKLLMPASPDRGDADGGKGSTGAAGDGNGGPEMLDLGLVGEVSEVDTTLLDHLAAGDCIPVIAPIGVSAEGRGYNINSDLVAGKVAEAMRAAKLILLTNTPGLLDENGATVSEMNLAQAAAMRAAGTISGGMLPKVRCALDAVRGGVAAATIADGRIEHATLLEVFTEAGFGTMIRPG
ncbi:MAG: acetylglutamate kinase [Immundisolibacterales bacterium]|nr:acetylglutamate kinase [Immundisolibacterales bacterium]